ncbi:MAG: hypothetical protein FWE67_09185 [Planctomycetaceae bacterium]|nr:hypothetical protein [Planctomycetaceae bacterium]
MRCPFFFLLLFLCALQVSAQMPQPPEERPRFRGWEGGRAELENLEIKTGADGLQYYEPRRVTPQTSTARYAKRRDDERLEEKVTHFSYYRRHESQPGDYKVVTVPAIHPRQAKIDAQTYHIGWEATDVWMGQSRVMYNVLLKKRPNYIPGTPPTAYPIPPIKP